MIDRLRFGSHKRPSLKSPFSFSSSSTARTTNNNTPQPQPSTSASGIGYNPHTHTGMSDTSNSSPSSPDSPSDSWTCKLRGSTNGTVMKSPGYKSPNSLYSWREKDRGGGGGYSDPDDADWIRVSPGRPAHHQGAHLFSPNGGGASPLGTSGQFSPADLHSKVDFYRSKARALSIQVTDLQDLVDHYQSETRRLEREVKRLNRLYQDAQHALSASQLALQGAHAFLDAPEEVTKEDVLNEVVRLNENVRAAAGFFVDAFPAMRMLQQGHVKSLDAGEVQMRAERGMMMIPAELAGALSHPSKGGKMKMLRVALEMTMTDVCAMFLEKWFPDSTLDYWIREVYEGIRATALQSVFGRWRTLTRAQLSTATKESAQMPLILLKSVLDRFTDITMAIGVPIDYCQLPSEWIKSMESTVGPISQSVVRLRQMMGEGHVQGDLTCLVVGNGEVFDESARCLRNRFGASGSVDRVLCTTGLGLGYIVKEEREELEGDEEGGGTAFRESILLEPEVVLESFIATASDD